MTRPATGCVTRWPEVLQRGWTMANNNGTALTLTNKERQTAMVEAVKDQMATVHALMAGAMVKDEDYGVIPGTKGKPTLLKPGAEKLCVLFRLSTKIETTMRDLGRGHREYETKVTLARRDQEGDFFGEGIGIASTMESKYRWRNAQRVCPDCGKAAIIKGKEEYGGGWVCFKKKDGCGAKFHDGDQAIEGQEAGKVENPDIADVWNTVMKMSKKRAFIDAVLTATGVSQIFTQDLEDMHGEPEHHDEHAPPAPPPPKQAPSKPVEPTITEGQWLELQSLANETADSRMALKTVLAHFHVTRAGQIPSKGFREACSMLARMRAPAPNEDADVPQEEMADAPM